MSIDPKVPFPVSSRSIHFLGVYLKRPIHALALCGFLFSSLSFADISLSLSVIPERLDEEGVKMECELSLSRGRRHPIAAADGITSSMVEIETYSKGYRIREGQAVYEEKRHTSSLSYDYDYLVGLVNQVKKAEVKSYQGGGSLGVRAIYSGKIDGKEFVIKDINERGSLSNQSKDAQLLETILNRNCYK